MANELCPRCSGPGCMPHPCPLELQLALPTEGGSGCTCCGKCALGCRTPSPILGDEAWTELAEQFLSEHAPVAAQHDDQFFIGWTVPRAWWEEA
jgi:hypothetical protein